MIRQMTRVRILGPRDRLDQALGALQDLELVHLTSPGTADGLVPIARSPREERHLGYLEAILRDVDASLAMLGIAPRERPAIDAADEDRIPSWARMARRLRRRLRRLDEEQERLGQEQALLERSASFFEAFATLEERGPAHSPTTTIYRLVLRADSKDAVTQLRAGLAEALEHDFDLRVHELASGETAVLLAVGSDAREHVDRLLAGSGVEELPTPEGYDVSDPDQWQESLATRRDQIIDELAAIGAERDRLGHEHGEELDVARRVLHDRAIELAALESTAATPHTFVVDGWLPDEALPGLESALSTALGDTIVVERLATERWTRADTPVVLSNPPLFRPFEVVTGVLPLPRYGSIDPTPFTAAFFPMFFGLILGDIGYGLILAALGIVLRARTRPGSTGRSISTIAMACAAFAILFGFVYGELFGDVGRRFGLEPLLIDREEALLGFLGFAFAIGCVHVALGLVLGVIGAWRGGHRREALGRGVALSMLTMVVLGLLAAFEVLPASLLTPMVVAVLVAFPVLVVLEGIIGPVELLSTIGNILSYARIMALGTASVVMAVVANRMIGITGSVVVGVLFALLFHAVNFAIGVFSPTIHALRLHYVEFFGKFYSPGGIEYRPLGHWRSSATAAGTTASEEG